MKSRRNAQTAKLISRLLLGVLLIALPLALGGGRPLANAVASILAILVLGYLAFVRKTSNFYGNTGLLAVGIATVSTAAQLIPIPTSWLGKLSPAALNLRYGIEHATAPITLDPPATYHELTKMLLYLACAVLAANLCRNLKWRKNLLWAIATSGLVIVFLGVLHKILGWQLTYNQFGAPDKLLPTSFINENHLAGFLGFVSLSTIGLAFSSIKRDAILAALVSLACTVGVFLSLSRAGTIIFAAFLCFTVPALFILHRRIQQSIETFLKPLVLMGIGITAAVITGISILPLPVHKQLYTLTNLSEFTANKKWAIWEPFSQMTSEFWLTGGGKGAFISYYPFYSKLPINLTYTHFENIIAQTIVDLGTVMGTITLLAFFYAWFKALHKHRNHAVFVAPLIGIAFLFIHNLVDFSFEMTGVALPVILVLSAWNAPDKQKSSQPNHTSIQGRRLLPFVILSLLLCVYSAQEATSFELNKETVGLSNAITKAQTSDRVVELANQAALHHPADYFIPFTTTWRLFELEGPSKLTRQWLNRALYLAPAFPKSHLLAGRALIQLGAVSQAMTEYRLAVKYDSRLILDIANEVFAKTKDLDRVSRLAPPDFKSSIRLFQFLLEKDATQEAEYLFFNSPMSSEPLKYEALLGLARVKNKQRKVDEAIEAATSAQKLNPKEHDSYILLYQIYDQQKKPQLAEHELKTGVSKAFRADKILTQLCNRKIAHGEYSEALEVTNRLIKYGTEKSFKNGELLKAKIYAKTGRRIEALRIYEKWRNKYPWKSNYRAWIIEIRLVINDLTGAKAELQDAKKGGVSKAGLFKLTSLIKAYKRND
jgi:tetratricopeptide (TPR) repeat protein